VRWILGDVHTVSCRLTYGGAPTDGRVDTGVDLDLVLASGVKGHVHMDMTSDDAFRQWVVRGTDATVSLNLLTGEILRETADGTVDQLRKPTGTDRDLAEQGLLSHALAVAEGEEKPRCSGADGVAVLEVVEAARRSAATSTPVALPPRQTRRDC
jgi:predicted dehydrogenase